jgi:hypothetical protein
MACWSFSLPAGKEGACPLAVTGKDTICGGCYAMINRYNIPNVLTAQWVRYLWLKERISKREIPEAVYEMTTAIKIHTNNNYFRFFDSGDFFHQDMIKICYHICKLLPEIKFWFPTRIWYTDNKTWQLWLHNLAALKNVSVRPSAIKFNDKPPRIIGLNKGTTVILSKKDKPKGVSICPKTLNGGNCHDNHCRSCWHHSKEIAYLVHGYIGRHKQPIISDKILKTRNLIKLTVGAN